MNLGAAMAGGNGARREDDFYPTPPEATQALLPVIADWPRFVWEPACGDGAMARVLEAAGRKVHATDLIDRGFGVGGVDFLATASLPGACGAIITNPPFNKAADFIQHANRLRVTHMGLLLKATFWHAASRLPLWGEWPPYAALPLTWRLDFDGRKSPVMDCTWFLWDRVSPPLPRPLPHPLTRAERRERAEIEAMLS